jgi:putative membrane protein
MKLRTIRWTVAAIALAVAAMLVAPAGAKTMAKKKAAPLTDANIAAIVLAANTIDIQNGELALKTSSDSTVKAFAQMMITDHTSVNDKAKALAGKLKLTPRPNAASRGLVSSMTAKRAALAKKSGTAFDKGYLDNEIAYHQAVVDMMNAQLVPGAKNAELKDLLTSVQPAFQAHLDHAKEARASLKD